MSDTRIGGACTYNRISGTATITRISLPTEPNSCWPDPVLVLMRFEPHAPDARFTYRWPTWPDEDVQYTVNGGLQPSFRWLYAAKLRVGSTYKCTRLEIISGTCTPVIHEVAELDQSWQSWSERNRSG